MHLRATLASPRWRGIGGMAVVLAALAAISGLLSVGDAYGYTHSWGSPNTCLYFPPYERCYDTAGAQYNPWIELRGETGIWGGTQSFNGMCAKAIPHQDDERSFGGLSS